MSANKVKRHARQVKKKRPQVFDTKYKDVTNMFEHIPRANFDNTFLRKLAVDFRNKSEQ